MLHEAKTDCVLALILGMWKGHRTRAFSRYIETLTGTAVTTQLDFDCFYVEEMSDGNPLNGDLFPLNTKSWIMNDEIGWQEITDSEAKKLLHMQTTTTNGLRLYRVPVFSFHLDCNVLILGECFGPTIAVRKVCHVNFDGGTCQVIDSRIAWIS